jgi:polyferredoxin
MKIDDHSNIDGHTKKDDTKRDTPVRSIDGFDLLRIKAFRSLALWQGFPYVFQLLMLVVFIGLTFIGWQVYTPHGINDKLFAKTNLVTLMIWGTWWPLMVWLAVTMGRVWCMICPLELVSNITERIGRKMAIKQKSLNKMMRSGAIIVFLYALIQLLVAGIHLHRIPAYTSFFLLGLLTLSAFVGLFFKDRAFCRGFCPIGMLLNAYGRGGMIAVRAGSGDTCAGCSGKDCIMACNRNKPNARSCPSLLNPPRLNTNKDCLVCGQCIKACEPDNMQLLLRRPFCESDAREEKASWPLTIFIMLVSGFVTYELSTEWEYANQVFLWIPRQLSLAVGLAENNGWIKGVWTLFLFPALLWSMLGALVSFFDNIEKLTTVWRRLALPMAVIIAAGHMAKAVAKMASWAGYLPHALREPAGLETVQKMTTGAIAPPAALLSKPLVSVIGLALIFVGIAFAIREFRMAQPTARKFHFIPKVAFGGLLSVIVFGWAYEFIPF